MTQRPFKYLLLEHLPALRQLFVKVCEDMEKQGTIKVEGILPNIANDGITDLKMVLGKNNFELVVIDFNFPWTASTNFKSARELSLYMHRHYPTTKKLLIVPNASIFKLMQLYGSVPLDGIMEARDCSAETIHTSIHAMLEHRPFFSKAVFGLFYLYILSEDILDKYDYLLLHELSIGTKITALPTKLLLSRSSIRRRRIKLKEFFKAEDDGTLLAKAKAQRYI